MYEKVAPGGGLTEHKHYIRAGGRDIALYVRKVQTGTPNVFTNTLYYLLSDHLGSTDVVTDASGAVVVRESYDAHGKRRGTNWSGSPSAAELNTIRDTTRRGFTSHEHMDAVDLIHMNGRVFDPNIGRFVSPDPFIDCQLDTQGWNRYSYVKNSPMRFTDPSGYATDEWPRMPDWWWGRPPYGTVGLGGHGPGGGKSPRPFGSSIGGIPGVTLDPQEEITATRPDESPISIPPVVLVDLDFSETITSALSVRDRVMIQEAGEAFDRCMENCTQFLTEAFVNPLSSVAAGAADGGLFGALGGAISAGLDSPEMSTVLPEALAGATYGRLTGMIDGKATPASTNRRSTAGAIGGAINGLIQEAGGNSNVAEVAGAVVGGAADSYLQAKWNKRGAVASTTAALKGGKGGLRGAIVSVGLRTAGKYGADALCDYGCSAPGN